MDITSFTSYDDIRSLLGLTKKELSDDNLALPHWYLAVEQDLRDIDGGAGAALTQFAAVEAVNETARTAAQAQFYKVASLYVLYNIGSQLLASADVFSPQSITDGKASISRLAERFDKLRPVILGGLQSLKNRLEEALLVLVPAAGVTAVATRRMIVSTGLAFDPVTGV
jgi:hypothetical protein